MDITTYNPTRWGFSIQVKPRMERERGREGLGRRRGIEDSWKKDRRKGKRGKEVRGEKDNFNDTVRSINTCIPTIQ